MAVTTPAPELGKPMPPFVLPGVDGRTYQGTDFAHAQCLLVVFTCNHCPYAQAVEDRVIALQDAYPQAQLQVVAICANDSTAYPDDAPPMLLERWRAKKMPFPYLYDEEQGVAKAFGAVCTPDFFLYDGARKLVYRGRLDDDWKHPGRVQRRELAEAVALTIAGQPAPRVQHPSIGCSIKWRARA